MVTDKDHRYKTRKFEVVVANARLGKSTCNRSPASRTLTQPPTLSDFFSERITGGELRGK